MQSSLGVSWSHVCSGLPGFDTTAQIVTTKFSAFSGSVPMLVNGSQLDFEGLDYQKVGSNPARIWAASHAAPFATGGSCGPLGLAYPCTDTQGRQWIHKFSIDGPAASPTPTPTPTPVPVFSNVSASLGCTATFNFTYSGYSPSYIVDLSLTSNFASGVYLSFGTGSSSPVAVTNPKKWTSYTYGRRLYYKVYNSTRTVSSPICSAVVTCP